MRERSRDKERLEHMLTYCALIDQTVERHGMDAIMSDPALYHGVVKFVENIGEATYMLTKEYRAAHPEVPWKQMEGMRHVLVHDYYRIEPDEVRAVVEDDLPALRPIIQALYEEELK